MKSVCIDVIPSPNLSNSDPVASALRYLEARLRHGTQLLSHSQDVCAFLQLSLAEEVSEVFAVIFLDSKHRLLAFEKLFHGTINESTVYPRRVLQKALEHNAAAVIVAHNHPSGHCEPSEADVEITRELRAILKVIQVKLLDHFIVSCPNSYSFVEHGLL
jgi:DNA repair protein RadC